MSRILLLLCLISGICHSQMLSFNLLSKVSAPSEKGIEETISLLEEARFDIVDMHGINDEFRLPADIIFRSSIDKSVVILSIYEDCYAPNMCNYLELFTNEEVYTHMLSEIQKDLTYQYVETEVQNSAIVKTFSKGIKGENNYTEVNFTITIKETLKKFLVTIINNGGRTIEIRPNLDYRDK